MTIVQTALVTSAIPFIALWFAIFNRFIPKTKKVSAYIQATASGFIMGSILIELTPRLLTGGIQWSYIIAFIIGFVIMLLIHKEESGCCSGNASNGSLVSFLFPFITEFVITAILIGIAAATKTALVYMIAISFGLCNFVCGLSISTRLTKLSVSSSKRFMITLCLTLIFPILAVLTAGSISLVSVTLLNDLIAFAVALLLFLVIINLLPEAFSERKKPAAAIFFSAIAFVFILSHLIA